MKKPNIKRKKSIRLPITLIACLILLICAFVYSDHNTAVRKTFTTATTHQPENFTELYFSNYSTLHHVLKPGTTYPVAFTITNHESKTFSYTYQTELTTQGKTVKSKPVSVTVNDGQSFHGLSHIFARQSGDQVELVIRVLNKNLTIHYKAQS